MKLSINSLRIGIFLIACSTLALELSLVRVFDVILTPNMGYAVITAAVFALGLGGIYLYIVPVKTEAGVRNTISVLYIAFAICVLGLRPVINELPFNLQVTESIPIQIFGWLGMYLTLVVPFFLSGLIISLMLSNYSAQVHSLYFFDLLGAAIGCLLIVPLITGYGPGGIQFIVAGMAFLGGSVFFARTSIRLVLGLIAIVCVVYPATQDGYLEYRGHANKRDVDQWTKSGLRDYVIWDPVSKVEVFRSRPDALNFALDGGQQGSWLTKFDGNFDIFYDAIEKNPDSYYFGLNSVVHHFKEKSNPEVLIIGAAVGGEIRAALAFDAKQVDGVELVSEMVDAARTRYSQYSGGVFTHPKVNYYASEGRTYLRSINKRYDIIQMFSNHTSSSMADGSAAAPAAYLQTVEAYVEYFTHLNDDGVMQINHHIYPRMLTTAAKAWRRLGRSDFSRHVLVAERWEPDNLPIMLIKMQPWTQGEVQKVMSYLNRENHRYTREVPQELALSHLVTGDNPYHESFTAPRRQLAHLRFWLGTHRQKSLTYDINLALSSASGEVLAQRRLPGKEMRDNAPVELFFDPPLINQGGSPLTLSLVAEQANDENGFIVWSHKQGGPQIDFRGAPRSFVLVFDPSNPDSNLIPARYLDQDFPKSRVPQSQYNFSPATDNNPYFSMIRRTFERVNPATSPFLDGGTAWLLNAQLGKIVSAEWLSLFIVGIVSIAFSGAFIFLPLFYSKRGCARWPGMGAYLVYFSCLGAGFILVELVLIQLFKKLIGYPIHTFATVLFALLVSAGIGSLMTKKLKIDTGNRWRLVFLGIVLYGGIFTLTAEWIFYFFLSYSTPIRIAVAVVILLPLGFGMGMPLPIGIARLGKVGPLGIPWAWGMNGFFTVFGGFLSVLLSVYFGFRIVLLAGFSIYLLGLMMYGRIRLAES